MFWIIVAVVVVVGLALAWWTSGRATGDSRGGIGRRIGGDQGYSDATLQAVKNRNESPGGGGPSSF